jgi:hypothetical protein
VNNKLPLPSETLRFLRAERTLDYDVEESEVGRIRLVEPDDLELDEIEISAGDSDLAELDPYDFLGGSYHVEVVNLVAESDDYDPAGILGWIPAYRSFGSWDTEHGTLLLFEGAKWADIVKDPRRYLDEQWAREGVGNTALFLWLALPFYLDDYEYVIEPYPDFCELHQTRLTTTPAPRLQRHEVALRDALRVRNIESYLDGLERTFAHPGVPASRSETYFCSRCSEAENQWLLAVQDGAAVPVKATEDQIVRCPTCQKAFSVDNRQVFVDGFHLTCGTRLLVIFPGGYPPAAS